MSASSQVNTEPQSVVECAKAGLCLAGPPEAAIRSTSPSATEHHYQADTNHSDTFGLIARLQEKLNALQSKAVAKRSDSLDLSPSLAGLDTTTNSFFLLEKKIVSDP